jgi:hypothetical protein
MGSMTMVRQPAFRILPVVLAAVVMLAMVGSVIHLVCEDEGGVGEPAEAAASAGLGLCVLSVLFLAGKVYRAARTLLTVRLVQIEPLRPLEVGRLRRFYGLPPPSPPPLLPLLQVWRT